MSRVSTIIPAYNAQDYIADAVQSCLAQTHSDHEVIVVDDGSTDRTPDVLRGFGDRIKVYRQENAGHVAARNFAASVATGDWLAFLDADDLWMPEKLTKQLAMASKEVGFVYTDRRNFGSADRVGETASQAYSLPEGQLFHQLIQNNFVTVSSVIIRKEWFDRLSGFSNAPTGSEDWDLWLRFAAAGGVMAVVREPLTHYRWHASSMTNNQELMCRGRVLTVERALGTNAGKRVPVKSKRRARANVLKCSAWYASQQMPRTATIWYLQSLLNYPWDVEVYKGIVTCVLAHAGIRK